MNLLEWRPFTGPHLPRIELGSKEALILRLIAAGCRYGLEMVEASYGRIGRGTIYVLLARMEDYRGVVRSELDGAERFPRRVYTITPLGLAWMRAAWPPFGLPPA